MKTTTYKIQTTRDDGTVISEDFVPREDIRFRLAIAYMLDRKYIDHMISVLHHAHEKQPGAVVDLIRVNGERIEWTGRMSIV